MTQENIINCLKIMSKVYGFTGTEKLEIEHQKKSHLQLSINITNIKEDDLEVVQDCIIENSDLWTKAIENVSSENFTCQSDQNKYMK